MNGGNHQQHQQHQQHVHFDEHALEMELSRLLVEHKMSMMMSNNQLFQPPPPLSLPPIHHQQQQQLRKSNELSKRPPPGLMMSEVQSKMMINHNNNNNNNCNITGDHQQQQQQMRFRTYSMSSTGSSGGKSTEGSSSPTICSDLGSTSSGYLSLNMAPSAGHHGHDSHHHHSDHESGSSSSASSQTSSPDLSRYQDMTSVQKLFFGDNIPLLKTRERSNSGTIFDHRRDFSTFNVLPVTKINSYHIKMEDESSHGNDDIRNFILSSLSAHRINRIQCILCQEYMQIYDKYPLIDGTFFLSPRQHSSNGNSIPVTLKSPILSSMSLLNMMTNECEKSSISKSNGNNHGGHGHHHNHHQKGGRRGSNGSKNGGPGVGKGSSASSSAGADSSTSQSSSASTGSGSKQFLQSVCMSCLEGWRFRIECRSCHRPWNGSNLTLGSMYSYDIFAALPCCVSRYACNSCEKAVMPPDRRLEFFSDYSQSIPCPSCGQRDHHFVKPLGLIFTRSK